MYLKNIKDWGKEKYICDCGFITKNIKKKDHIDNELCWWLSKMNYGNVSGKRKVKCHFCDKLVMVCGLHIHMKSCLNI